MFDAKVLIKRLPFFSVPKITVIRHVKLILKLQLTWQTQTVLWKNARTLKGNMCKNMLPLKITYFAPYLLEELHVMSFNEDYMTYELFSW